jgi:Zn-dependent peptidase ImmA (M78 family)
MTYNPWDDAARRYPDVHIEWHAMLGAHAAWAPVERVILVDESITRTERRCALAHELAHLDMGDEPTEHCFFARRQETAADRLAAVRLVAIRDLAAAVRYCDDARELAAELDVTLNALVLRCALLHPSERGLIDRVLIARDRVA